MDDRLGEYRGCDRRRECNGTCSFLIFGRNGDVQHYVEYHGHNLAANPEIQEKLRKEVKSTVEKHGGLTFNTLNDMTYMNQVINESQKLHTAVDFLQKLYTKEFELQG